MPVASANPLSAHEEAQTMKEIFFKGLVVALPLCVIGGLIYCIFIGFYSLYSDMRLKRELAQIAREAEERRRQQPKEENAPASSSSVEDMFKS